MTADSPEAFLRKRRGPAGWEMFAALKEQVDHLVDIDLSEAAKLVKRIEEVAVLTEDLTSRSFAQAARASLLHALGSHSEANRLYELSADAIRSEGHRTQSAILHKQRVFTLTHMG